jgi:predicted DNA-binding transcriptional regulator AlpA
VKPVSRINPLDRATWPETLRRCDLALIFRCSLPTIDKRRRLGFLPREVPSQSWRDVSWSKASVVEWLDNPRTRMRGVRAA